MSELTPEARALLIKTQDHVIELAVERDNAMQSGDDRRVRELGTEIGRLMQECEAIKHIS